MIDADAVDPMPDTDGTLFDGDPIPLTQQVRISPFPADSLPKPIAEMVQADNTDSAEVPGIAGSV